MMKKKRQTWYAIKCGGHVCGVMASYCSLELEATELYINATKQMHNSGHDCFAKLKMQGSIPCEDLTVEPLLSEEDQS